MLLPGGREQTVKSRELGRLYAAQARKPQGRVIHSW